jgi:hypothetical protein
MFYSSDSMGKIKGDGIVTSHHPWPRFDFLSKILSLHDIVKKKI